MGVTCRIIRTNEGVIALNSEGNTSELFMDIALYIGDQEKALDLWALTHTEDFKNTFGGRSDNMVIEDVVAYLDVVDSNKSELSPSEKIQIEDLMASRGIERLSDFRDLLLDIFKPNGFLDINEALALESGLYTQDDLMQIDLTEVETILHKIEGELGDGRDFSVTPINSGFVVAKSDSKTILGTSEVVGITSTRREVENSIEDFTSEEAINAAVQNAGLRSYVDRFNEDQDFREKELERYKSLTKVPTLYLSTTGQITDQNQATYKTIKNTISSEIESLEIEADLEFLEEIPQRVWVDKKDSVVKVLRELEETLTDYNIDLIGLSEIATERENVLSIIQPLRELITNVSDNTIRNFAEAKDGILPGENAYSVQKLSEKYRGLNVVRVNSRFTDTELYSLHGLIKLKDNLYHKVQRMEDTSTAYEFLYEKVVADEMSIPQRFVIEKDYKNADNKVQVLKDISKWVNSRETGIQTENQEEVSLYQLIFDHDPIPTQDFSKLNQIETNVDYLMGDFVADFYSYYLKEKLKDSKVYRNTLSRLSFNDSDIEMAAPIDNLQEVDMGQELSDYFRLKSTTGSDYLFPNEGVFTWQDLSVLNDPSQVSEFNGEVIEDGDFLITQPISDMYVRHNGQLYRKGITRTDANLYVAIDPISIPNYNTTNMNFEFDTELAERVINRYPEGVETRGLTTEEFDDRVEKAGVENLMHQRLQVVGEQAILTNEMKSSLKQAKTLVSEGVDPKIIEVETGWFIEDGKWKYFSRDILDQYKIKEDLDIVVNKEYQLKDIIDSSLLERLYPDIAKTKIIFYDNRETETIEEPDGLFTLGFYRGGSIFLNILESDIRPNVQIEGKSRKQELINALFSRDLGGRHDVHIDSIKRRLWGTTLLHEVQHLVQAKEGFSQGGSPNLFASITRTVYPEIANTNFKSASFNRTENINGIAQTIDSNFRLVDPQDKSEITCRT